MVNEDKLSSLAALAEGITPNREPGVVCIETDQRNIFLRKEHGMSVSCDELCSVFFFFSPSKYSNKQPGTTVIVAHDTE